MPVSCKPSSRQLPCGCFLQALSPPADPYTLPRPTGQLPSNITLYQYEVCPFCCKVKAFLDYHKVRLQPLLPLPDMNCFIVKMPLAS